MGFYGNITNTSRTTFQFDRIYSSRQAMDDNCLQDGIYAGRYVLVEYDSELSSSDYNKNWHLVTDTDGKNIPYGSVSTDQATNNYLYFNGPDVSTSQVASVVQASSIKVIYFDKYKHFSILNNRAIYIRLKSNGSFTSLTWDQFRNHYEYQGSENSVINTSREQLESEGLVFAHIANGIAHIQDTSLFKDANTEIYAVVLPGANYTYNVDPEFWSIENTTFSYSDRKTYAYLTQVPNDASGNYLANFNIDKGRYNTSRGYDSTVWQKVYQNGTEKYVMIAELNTVIPTFGVTSDPPSMLPINPHFGADSTNQYYDLHWQPNWGFRIKAANNSLMIPQVSPNGQLNLTDQNNIQSQYASVYARDRSLDDIYYPSDERVKWTQTFEDNTLAQDDRRKTLYFDTDSQKWGTDSSATVPSAIYFNRSGFNSSKIAYSEDLISEKSRTSFPSWNRYNSTIKSSGWTNEDDISLSPTGLSGNVYNQHDGSVDLKPDTDTQELTIMLPSIGDTMAKVWDLVYGGRETTPAIASTNFRNKDIAWEDAKGEPARRGLRLTGIDGDEYNTAQVDTLAGAINTAHDLIGMIISSNTHSELSDVNNLDENRIYYDSDKHEYFRKHKTYEYTPLKEDTFEYNQQTTSNLNQEKIDSGLYYELDPETEKYVIATVYDPSKQYFLKQATEQYTVISGKLVNFPYGDYKWYRDYLGENSKIIEDIPTGLQEARSDYILDNTYHEGRDYYKVTATEVTLSQNYTPETYWYKTMKNDRQQFVLDLSDARQKDTVYYTFDTNRLLSLKADRNFRGVYVPGIYYYQLVDGTYQLDLSDYQTCNGDLNAGKVKLNQDGTFNYYLLNVIRTYDTTGTEKLYKRKYDYQVVSDLSDSTFVKNTYYQRTNGNEYTLATEFSQGTTYYFRQTIYEEIQDTTQVEIDILETFPSETLVVYKVGTYFLRDTNASGELRSFTEITRSDFLNDSSIFQKEVWVLGEKANSIPPFLSLDEAIAKNDIIKKQDNFYQENTYHYMKNGSYILDTSTSLTTGRKYYNITPRKMTEDVTYYEDGKYYVEAEVEDKFELAIDATKPEGNIYKKEDYYVIYDDRHILDKGSKWNADASAIPPEVTLGTRQEKWEIINMPDYSKTMSTLNGMILKMHQIIEPYDKLTRENDNVSGVINQLKDTIAKFDRLKSQEIVIVDNYGRMHSAPIATLQQSSYNKQKESGDFVDGVTKDVFPKASSTGSMIHRWITVNTDGDPENPILTIHHNYQPVNDTQSWLNKNDANTTQAGASSIIGDKIDLYTPIVDGMGHVVGKNTQTVTLPYGFKTIKNNGVGSQTSQLSTSTADIIADNTQDTFTLNSHNEWIRLAANSENDSLTIAHKLYTPTGEAASTQNTDLNDPALDTITVQDTSFDAAGHIKENHSHTYTLPYSFKFFKVGAANTTENNLAHDDSKTVAADNTQDTFTLNPGNTWIHISADDSNDSFTIGHCVRSIDTANNGTTNLNASGVIGDSNNQITIPDWSYDNAGHIRSKKSHIYTLPYSFKFITTNGSVGAEADNSITPTTNIVSEALNTQDTFNINVGNQWLKAAIDKDNRSITLYHYKNSIDETSSTSTNFNNISNGQFSLYDITHDAAGHITAWKSHSYTLPYGWKTVTHSNSTAVTQLDLTDYDATAHKIVASNVIDSIAFAASNKWIRLKANDKTLSIAHEVHPFNLSTNTGSVSSTTSGTTTFEVIDNITWDEAGHLTSANKKTITVPQGFANVSITNSNGTEELVTNTHQVTADSTADTLTLAAADRWIRIASDNNTIKIGHALPNATYSFDKGQTAAASLNYGGKFKVVNVKADKFGHIGSLNEYEITLPSISLTLNSDSGNLVTGLSLNSATGAFTYTQNNVGALALTGWSYDSTSQIAGNIAATDSINNAFAKLQKRIANEEANRLSAIQNLDSSLSNSNVGKTLTGITITDGKISGSTFEDINIISSQVSDLNTTIEAAINDLDSNLVNTATNKTLTGITVTNGKITGSTFEDISITSDQVNDLDDTIENAINELKVDNQTSILSSNKTIATLSQSNGKISYTTQNISITSSQVSDLSTTINNAISALTGTLNGTAGTGKTITALSQTNGKISATFGDIAITASQVTVNDSNNFDSRYAKKADMSLSELVPENQIHIVKSLSQSDGVLKATTEQLGWSHISPLLPTGSEAFIQQNTVFTYGEDSSVTLAQLVSKVKTQEDKIAQLEERISELEQNNVQPEEGTE